MKLGLLLHPDRGVDFLYEEARQADLQGYDSVWIGDHLWGGHGSGRNKTEGPYGPLESFTVMSAVAAVTSRTKLGWRMLNVDFRHPVVLAKSLTTLDQMTRGRVICSIGAGSDLRERKAYGIPVLEHDARVERLREVIQLFKTLWTNPAPALTNFKGKYVTVTDLPFNPKPYQKPHIPIWIGGESDDTTQAVKDLADGWVTLSRSPYGVGEKGLVDPAVRITQVLSSPDWPKKPMTVVVQIQMFVAESREAAVADAKSVLGDRYGAMEGFINREIVGTAERMHGTYR